MSNTFFQEAKNFLGWASPPLRPPGYGSGYSQYEPKTCTYQWSKLNGITLLCLILFLITLRIVYILWIYLQLFRQQLTEF